MAFLRLKAPLKKAAAKAADELCSITADFFYVLAVDGCQKIFKTAGHRTKYLL
jgi:hypothetical protein